jgi:hypothetical protein
MVGVAVGAAGRNGVVEGAAKGSTVANGSFIAIAGPRLDEPGALQDTRANIINVNSHACLGIVLFRVFTSRILIALTSGKDAGFPPCLPIMVFLIAQDARTAPDYAMGCVGSGS